MSAVRTKPVTAEQAARLTFHMADGRTLSAEAFCDWLRSQPAAEAIETAASTVQALVIDLADEMADRAAFEEESRSDAIVHETVRQQLAEATTTIGELQRALAEKDRDIEHLSNQLERSRQQLSEDQRRLHEATDQLKRLKGSTMVLKDDGRGTRTRKDFILEKRDGIPNTIVGVIETSAPVSEWADGTPAARRPKPTHLGPEAG